MKDNKQKRKVRKSFLVIMAVFILSVAAILSITVLFPINELKVEYSGKTYSDAEIIKASGARVGDNIIMLSKNSVSEKVEKDLPYIEKLTVTKKIPDKVVLSVKEAKEKFCFKSGEKYLIVSDKYKLLKSQSTPDKKLTCVNAGLLKADFGTTVSLKKSTEKNLINKIQTALKTRMINYIDFSDSSNVVFYIDKKFKVKFGTMSDVNDKLEFLKKMLSDIEGKNKKSKGTVNLQYFQSKKEGYFSRDDFKIEYFKAS